MRYIIDRKFKPAYILRVRWGVLCGDRFCGSATVHSFLNYLKLEDMGIYTAFGKQYKSEEKLDELREFGRNLK